ncbi:MAG TPA: Sua5 family C-terminal domain-containing protein, partial [Burkholderiaceae bacterium]|nr:Sua5 family C-terminal domain-containing protein [Burkholderiaceae bacterium]
SARVRLMDAREMQAALDLMGADARHIALYSRTPLATVSPHVLRQHMPQEAEACAQELFAMLRELDRPNVKLIWVETPPEDPAWDGVRDRLTRAAA